LPSSARPPEQVYFVDRNLGKRFPEILRNHGLRVEVHDDHFPGDNKPADEVWLRYTAERGWIAVSQDARIRYTSLSRDAIAETGARLIIVKGTARTTQLAENFVRTGLAIARFVDRHEGPWIAKLYRDPRGDERPGRIELWFEPESED